MIFRHTISALIASFVAVAMPALVHANDITLLNVSYDPTRELYREINKVFIANWEATTKQKLIIRQSHGGSSKQARSVMDGLGADVVTLGLGYDIDVLVDRAKLLPANWQSRLPNNSAPYISTIVFVVRKGNPKAIRDWPDLVKPGIAVITANPKTSSGARWAYMAAWGDAYLANANSEAKAREFITRLFKNVPVLDAGARGSTVTFTRRGVGDVLLAWENEAFLAQKEFGADQLEIIMPPHSIRAEPPVALVDKVVDRHGTRQVAEAYLQFLYSAEGQEIIARHFYRPVDSSAAVRALAKANRHFLPVNLFTLADVAGDWRTTQKKHFDDGGVFDQISEPDKK